MTPRFLPVASLSLEMEGLQHEKEKYKREKDQARPHKPGNGAG